MSNAAAPPRHPEAPAGGVPDALMAMRRSQRPQNTRRRRRTRGARPCRGARESLGAEDHHEPSPEIILWATRRIAQVARYKADGIGAILVEHGAQSWIPAGHADLDAALLVAAEPQVVEEMRIVRTAREVLSAFDPRRLDFFRHADPSVRHQPQLVCFGGS